MAVKSYLIFPVSGKKNLLAEKLKMHQNFEVLPAENKDVIVLVTESENKSQEDDIQEELNAMQEIKHYSLVSGFEQ